MSKRNLITRLVLNSGGILSNVSIKGLKPFKEEELISARFRSFMIDMKLTGKYTGIFTHIPNEGRRSQQASRVLKAMGMVPGFADWILAGPWGNCVIELKAPGKEKELRQSQKDFKEWCDADGIPHFVCTSVVQAEAVLISVGALPTPAPDLGQPLEAAQRNC